MGASTYFLQECPTCGRSLEIRVEYLGKRLVCQHCRGELLATGPRDSAVTSEESSSELLRRVDELLAESQQRKAIAG